ncbi:MAG: DUF362 domain-containing protein [Candidatus Bathyarchaeota archaeon]|nr:DUF362 domain-containing protein [Candidatus Bathyarchaeota archaeon]
MMQQRTVNILKAHDDISEILKKAVGNTQLSGKQRIFVKPNLSHPEYVPGVVTDPTVAFELVGLLRNRAEEVIVGESDGFNYSCRVAFEKTGMETAVKKAGGSIINLSEDKLVKVKLQGGTSRLKALFLPKTVLDADVIVDLALMKTHEWAMYSGAIKNLFGCIPSNKRIYLHPYINEVFYQLYKILQPQLTIMDARVALEGNGPTKGTPVKMGLMLTSNCALAIDLVASKLMGLSLEEVDYLRYIAGKENLQVNVINVQGVQITEAARKFRRPKIDLPVKAQAMIYKHELLTKMFFCSLSFVKLLQKATVTYRGKPLEEASLAPQHKHQALS